MNRIYNRIFNLLLMILGTLSLISLEIETFHCTVTDYFLLWAALVCVFVWALTHLSRGMLFGIPCFGLSLFYILRFRFAELRLSFEDLIDKITGVFWEQVLHRGMYYAFADLTEDHTLIFIILTLLFALWLALSLTSHGTRLQLTLIGGLPFFALCVLLDETPGIPAVVGMLLFWLLTASGGSDYQEDSFSYSAVLGTVLPLLVLLLALIRFVDPDHYVFTKPNPDPMDLMKQAEQRIEKMADDYFELGIQNDSSMLPTYSPQVQDQNSSQAMMQNSFSSDREQEDSCIPEEILWEDASGGMDLTNDLSEADLSRIFLQVHSPNNGMVYLRGISFGDYTGTGWLPAEEYSHGSSLDFTARAILETAEEQQTLKVREVVPSQYIFVPYFSTLKGTSDRYVESAGSEEYSVPFVRPSYEALLYPDTRAEESYRLFAHNVYTRLPESIRTALAALCEREGLSASSPDIVSEVAVYIKEIGIYDLDAVSAAEGDIALQFLTEDHRGICVHFATAAAVLYRCLGIPARITEGFLIKAEAGKYVEVKGADAHAWVEVYQDGVGWLPVEVTGQSGLDAEEILPNTKEPQTDLEENEISPESEMLNNTTDSAAYEPEQAEIDQVETSVSQDRFTGEEDMPDGNAEQTHTKQGTERERDLPVGVVQQPAGKETTPVWKTLFFKVFTLIALFSILPLRRQILLSIHRRNITQSENEKAVIALYHLAERTSRYDHPIPDSIRTAAEKAAFSNHSITDEEMDNCRIAYAKMVDDTWQDLKTWQKITFVLVDAIK